MPITVEHASNPDAPDIDFSPNLFNNVYWHLEEAFNNPSIRFIWAYGGSSASKTYSVVQLVVKTMLENVEENTMVLRKYGVDIRDSIYSDFKTVISEWGLTHLFTIQINFIICNETGSYVRFRGLDDSEKIKGLAGFKRVILEEISQFDHVDFKQVRKRLRGKPGQQIISIFNPVDEGHWIKIEIFDKEQLTEVPTNITGKWYNEKGNTVILKTNYTDNVFIVGRWRKGKLVGGFVDQATIDDFEKDKETDHAYYEVYGLGNWGRLRTGGEFWKDFNANLHLTDIGFDPERAIHLSWDENVNPFLTCLVWQLYGTDNKIRPGRKVAIQIDEICLPDPNNRVRNVCREFMARNPQGVVKGLFVYGDRTSVKEDTKLEKGENFFTKIVEYLRDYKPNLRLQSSNPSVVQSGGFVNACYRNATDITVLINRKCKKSINDYQYAPEASDGTLDKQKTKNKLTGVSYEKWGHPSDAKRYILTTAFAADYQKYLLGGKRVSVRTGKSTHKHAV